MTALPQRLSYSDCLNCIKCSLIWSCDDVVPAIHSKNGHFSELFLDWYLSGVCLRKKSTEKS